MTPPRDTAAAPQHTPGLWRANGIHEQSPEPSAQTRVVIVSDDDGRVVAYLPADGAEGLQDRETLANARLIAACPIMYEYLVTRASLGDNEANRIIEEIGVAKSDKGA